MKLLTIIILWALTPILCGAQGTALLLKKKGKTVKRYYPGLHFEFVTTDGMPAQGKMEKLTRDSVFLVYYQLVQVPTQFGTYYTDTAGRYRQKYSVANIGSLPRATTGKSKGLKLLSGAMVLGGLAYTFLNIFNTVREGDPPFAKENLDNVLIGLGTAATGWLLGRSGPNSYEIGRKYYLEVVE